MQFSRVWAMPNSNTFSIRPIGDFVRKYLAHSVVSVDPFARDNNWATHTNDLNPETKAQNHLDAVDFLTHLNAEGVKVDLAIFDPPYSPRQISECYKGVGRKATMEDTQSGWYIKIKTALVPLLLPNAIVLSFGWNSGGLGKKNGGVIEEILLVNHGGAHNDTICVAERIQ